MCIRDSKYTYILLAVLILPLLIACSDSNEEEFEDTGTYSAEISSISKDFFAYGDTLLIYGKNFGSEQNDTYVEFNGSSDMDIQYLEWSDTLISVVVPSDIDNGRVKIKKSFSNSFKYNVNKPLWKTIIDYSVIISLIVTVIFVYLQINKIWKRKHEREVADSQSLAGLSMFIVNCILWVAYYLFVEDDFISFLDTAIYVFQGSIFFLIGTGLFVKGQRYTGLWKLIRQSLKLERKEADYLLKRFFKPKHAEIIISILHQLAMIDEELDDRELEILTVFAKEWNIDYNADRFNKERSLGTESNYIRLRSSVLNYLEEEPPIEQIAQLKDLIDELIKADDKVSEEEELISAELLPLIEGYLNKENSIKKYHVIIVPQKPEHEAKIRELVPDSVKVETAGGVAYSMGTFFSIKYADMICKQFRQHNLFTIVHTMEE